MATYVDHACPVLNVDSARFNNVELYPYKRLIEAGIDSIMVAHWTIPISIRTIFRPYQERLLQESSVTSSDLKE